MTPHISLRRLHVVSLGALLVAMNSAWAQEAATELDPVVVVDDGAEPAGTRDTCC